MIEGPKSASCRMKPFLREIPTCGKLTNLLLVFCSLQFTAWKSAPQPFSSQTGSLLLQLGRGSNSYLYCVHRRNRCNFVKGPSSLRPSFVSAFLRGEFPKSAKHGWAWQQKGLLATANPLSSSPHLHTWAGPLSFHRPVSSTR